MDNLDIKGQNCTIWRKTDTFERAVGFISRLTIGDLFLIDS